MDIDFNDYYNILFCAGIDYMSENSDFIVVGIVGAGSVGKSFILNSVIKLSNYQSINPDDSSNYNADGQSKPQAERTFRVQTFEKQMLSEHCTYPLYIFCKYL